MSEKARFLKRHVGSTRHQQGEKVLEAQKSKQQSIAVAMKKVNDDIHLKGETLPGKELVFRCEVVQTVLRAGVPLSKCSISDHCLREEVHDSLIGPFSQGNVCRQCLRAILHTERSHIQQTIAGHPVAVIIDGSTPCGEVLAVIIRFFG